MTPSSLPLSGLLAAFVMACAAQLQQPQLWPRGWYAGLLLAAALLWLAGRMPARRRAAACLAGLLAAAALGFAQTGWRARAQLDEALNPALEGRDVQVVGLVAAMPQRSEGGQRFRLALASARLDGTPVRLPPQLYLSWYGDPPAGAEDEARRAAAPPPEVRAGQRWQLTVRLKAPHGNSNPHGFDYELWLWEQGLQATGYVRAEPAPRLLVQTWQQPVEQARQRVRDAIFERVSDTRLAGILAALVVGDQAAIERADWDIFRASGVAHLMSISGLHVTMFAWLAAGCAGWLWRRSRRLCLHCAAPLAALVAGVLLATAYALFSGWGLPAQRTVCMLATVAALRLGARRWPWPLVWLLAMAVVVALDPWALLQAGFWLSFVAVGVLFASDGASATTPGAAAGPVPAGWRRWGGWLAVHGRQALREQWVVTVALTPLSLLLFQQVSLVGLPANALAIPWVTLVLTPLAMLGMVWAPLWDLAAQAAAALAAVLGWLAAWPLASLSVPAPPLWAGVAGVFGGLLLVMRLPWALRAGGLALLLPALLWQAPRPPAGAFELLAADVGQGNAVLVRTARHSLLYDAGPRFSRESDAGHRTLVPLLRALDERLDVLLISHRDSDHVGGARSVLQMQPQAVLLASLEDGHELLSRPGTMRCEAGRRWQWDGVDFELLHPLPGAASLGLKSNALSCVLRISGAGVAALLVGDLEAPQEAALLARQAPLAADLLLVPHHGSKTSSSPAFLQQVRPSLGIVQAGYRNRFGHPAPLVLKRYEEAGVPLADSAHCGAVHWTSLRPQAWQCQRALDRRYWHHQPP